MFSMIMRLFLSKKTLIQVSEFWAEFQGGRKEKARNQGHGASGRAVTRELEGADVQRALAALPAATERTLAFTVALH
jgi:hypothetical protein